MNSGRVMLLLFIGGLIGVACLVGIIVYLSIPKDNIADKIIWNSAACPNASWHQYGSKCYKMASAVPSHNFNLALDYCTKHRYRLVLPTSDEENRAFLAMFGPGVKGYMDNWVWLGLRRPIGGGLNDFYDANNEDVRISYTNWAENEPNNVANVQFCVVISRANVDGYHAGQWWDDDCEGHFYNTVCETDAIAGTAQPV